jgi:hypothetical protein
MSTVENDTTGASGTGPASGYNLKLSHLFIVFFLFLYRLSANTSNPYDAIILLIFTNSMICFMIFEIKIYRKIPKTLKVLSIEADFCMISEFLANLAKYANLPNFGVIIAKLADLSNFGVNTKEKSR